MLKHGFSIQRLAPVGITSSGYYYIDAITMVKFAGLLGHQQDQEEFLALAENIRTVFRSNFYHGDGLYGQGEWTSLACAVYRGLADPDEADAAVRLLLESVRKNQRRTDFGMLGAKYVPRVLAKYGYAEDAYRLITQPEFPGWGNWLKRGAASLWENWNGSESRNPIMFGDIFAWMFEFLGGFSPLEKAPGFRHFKIQPNPVSPLQFVQMRHDCPFGRIQSAWQQNDHPFSLQLAIPAGTGADLILPDGTRHHVHAGQYDFQCQIP